MLRRTIGWVVFVGFSVACGSSGGTAQPDTEPGSTHGEVEPSSEANSADPAADPAVRYQFVGTPEGMTVEAVSGTEVQTFSCPTRSCAGFCDECAVRACAASGELAGVCAQLARECSDTCSCNGVEGGIMNCGFPVCALNRNLCYIGDSDQLSGSGPQPDPNPLNPASRPSNPAGSDAPSSGAPSSGAPSSSAPSGAGANISLPAG